MTYRRTDYEWLRRHVEDACRAVAAWPVWKRESTTALGAKDSDGELRSPKENI